jgi:hypothetical protein
MRLGQMIGNALRDLFTEHLVAKFFALVFAIVVVGLIDRELRSAWIDDQDVVVLTVEEARQRRGQKFAIVLEPEAGVVIMRRPEFLRVRIKGPDRLRAEFEKRQPIVVKVKRSWASPDDEIKVRQLEERDIDVGFQDAEIEVLGEGRNRQVTVDLIAVLDGVEVEVERPKKIPPSYEYDPLDTICRPPQVKLQGPRSVLRSLGVQGPGGKLKLEVEDAEPVVGEDVWQKARLRSLDSSSQVIMLPELVEVRLGFKARPLVQQRTLESVPIDVRLARDQVVDLQSGRLAFEFGLVKMLCTITLEVSQAASERPDLGDELRRSIATTVDLTSAVREMKGSTAQARPAVRVRGEPEGVKVLKVEPSTVPIVITKK